MVSLGQEVQRAISLGLADLLALGFANDGLCLPWAARCVKRHCQPPLCLQVFRCRLRLSGEEVAVKVQRPDMAREVTLDLYLLRR